MWLMLHFTCVFIYIALLLGTRFFVSLNRVQDKGIEEACSELANVTGMDVQYRTKFVGVCKPRGAQPFRAIAIVPKDPVVVGIALANQGNQPLLPSSVP